MIGNGNGREPAPQKLTIYRPGYSFMNAPLVVPVTRPRANPWVALTWGPGPMSALSKQRRWGSEILPHYRAYYRRGAKQRSYLQGIGEVPGDHELALGQAPGPTDKESSVQREGFGGKLSNVLTSIGDIFVASQQKQAVMSRARTETYLEALQRQSRAQVGIGGMQIPILLLVGGAALLFLVPMMTRRRGVR